MTAFYILRTDGPLHTRSGGLHDPFRGLVPPNQDSHKVSHRWSVVARMLARSKESFRSASARKIDGAGTAPHESPNLRA